MRRYAMSCRVVLCYTMLGGVALRCGLCGKSISRKDFPIINQFSIKITLRTSSAATQRPTEPLPPRNPAARAFPSPSPHCTHTFAYLTFTSILVVKLLLPNNLLLLMLLFCRKKFCLKLFGFIISGFLVQQLRSRACNLLCMSPLVIFVALTGGFVVVFC